MQLIFAGLSFVEVVAGRGPGTRVYLSEACKVKETRGLVASTSIYSTCIKVANLTPCYHLQG